VAEPWKFTYHKKLLKSKDRIKTLNKMVSDSPKYRDYLNSLRKRVNQLEESLTRNEQIKVLQDSKTFLKNETRLKISILKTPKKGKIATPAKPGILLE